ncbi:MAG: hypothetical protein NTX00_00245 [Candidatus Parcubacteria bacterium]|nr:hypothetical protein [Candidatus Parcubacteria bacterium]
MEFKFFSEKPKGKEVKNNLENLRDAKSDLELDLEVISDYKANPKHTLNPENTILKEYYSTAKDLERHMKERKKNPEYDFGSGEPVSAEEEQGYKSLTETFYFLQALSDAMKNKNEQKEKELFELAARRHLNDLFYAAELYELIDKYRGQIIPEFENNDFREQIADDVNESIINLKKVALNLAKLKFPKDYKKQVEEHGEQWKALDKGRAFNEEKRRFNPEKKDKAA